MVAYPNLISAMAVREISHISKLNRGKQKNLSQKAEWGNRIQIRGSRKDSSSIFPRYSYLESFRPCPAARLSGWGTGKGVRA